jgi:hypothetical protein
MATMACPGGTASAAVRLLDECLVEIQPDRLHVLELGDQPAHLRIFDEVAYRGTPAPQVHPLGEYLLAVPPGVPRGDLGRRGVHAWSRHPYARSCRGASPGSGAAVPWGA